MPGAEKYVQLNTNVTPGKKIKVFESTDSFGNTVETQGVVVTDSAGVEISPAREATLAAIQAVLSSGITVSGGTTEATLTSVLSVLDSLLVELGQKTEPSNTQLVSAVSLPLPLGASTEATLLAISVVLANILSELSAKTEPSNQQHVLIDNSSISVSGPLTDAELRAVAVPVSAAALPLPAGASTESTLALIKAKTDNIDIALSSLTKPSDQQETIEPYLKQRYDVQTSVIYIGYSSVGTSESAPAWRIKQVDLDGQGNPTQTRWTSNTAVWDNRASESYS